MKTKYDYFMKCHYSVLFSSSKRCVQNQAEAQWLKQVYV